MLAEHAESLEVDHTTVETVETFENIRNDLKARTVDAIRVGLETSNSILCKQLL